jgi:hypothetical protein
MSTGKAAKLLKMFHALNTVLITIAAVGLITVAAVFFMMSFAADPVDVKMKLLTPKVAFGDEFQIEFLNERFEVCQTTSNYSIHDSVGTKITFPEIATSAVGKLGFETTRRRIKITKNMFGQDIMPGPARYRLIISWVCPGNYYQRYAFPKTHVYDDVPFEITQE